ncbi:MAG TPA: histidine kinase dimerization/phospho-acceptor domain-containing protein [Vicinamibacterales bacterium]|nr:histidine kinase dimerization/phospho-acceptor domain-containing protein [Vicinamibacterales bacterium]
MRSEDQQRRLEREQTDESLRAEREKADQTLEDSAIDETADAVISRARSRADKILAASRAKTDRASVPATPIPTLLKRERARENQVLQEERATADEVVREERAEHLALLWLERQETDEDLSHERELSDDALATRDEFLAIVSHDLRNLLNAIVGSATLIEKGALQTDLVETNLVEQLATHARRIQRAGARMNRLIGDLVDVASIEAGALAVTREIGDPTTVVTVAVDAFQVQAATAGVSLAAPPRGCRVRRREPHVRAQSGGMMRRVGAARRSSCRDQSCIDVDRAATRTVRSLHVSARHRHPPPRPGPTSLLNAGAQLPTLHLSDTVSTVLNSEHPRHLVNNPRLGPPTRQAEPGRETSSSRSETTRRQSR